MGFRFGNFNPIYRICMTRLCSNTHNLSHSNLLRQQSPNSIFQDPSVVLTQNPVYNITRRWHLGHSHHHHHHSDNDESGVEGEKIFKLGLASDVVLATGKALTGYLSGSTAIIADAAHSISDVVMQSFSFSLSMDYGYIY